MLSSIGRSLVLLGVIYLCECVINSAAKVPIIFVTDPVKCFSSFGCKKFGGYLVSTDGNIGACCKASRSHSIILKSPPPGFNDVCIGCSRYKCFYGNQCYGKGFGGVSDPESCCDKFGSFSLTYYSKYNKKLTVCVRCPPGGGGGDPHFSVLLPNGYNLCFSIQGEQGFVFNLIHSPQITVNALFIKDDYRNEVTWMGSLSVIINHLPYHGSNHTILHFDIADRTINIDTDNELKANDIKEISIDKDHLKVLSRESPVTDSKVLILMKEIGLVFTVEYMQTHLDILFQSVPQISTHNCSYHGLLGQFFCQGHTLDLTRQLLLFPDSKREPLPVKKSPIWSFMEREKDSIQHCWMAMNTGYQGQGLIEGSYLDYLVPSLNAIPSSIKQ